MVNKEEGDRLMRALVAALVASAALVLIGRAIHDRNLQRKIENGGD